MHFELRERPDDTAEHAVTFKLLPDCPAFEGHGRRMLDIDGCRRRSGERSGEQSSEGALYYISCTHRPHYALYGTVGDGGLG